MTDLKWGPLVGEVVRSTRSWQAIADDLKPRFLEIDGTVGGRLQSVVRTLGDEAIDVMKQHGLVVHQVPSDSIARWERSARCSYPTIIGNLVPAGMVAEVEQLRDEYRKLQKAE